MSMNTNRNTKIVATLGPATDNPETLHTIIRAGVNVVRINFSHGHVDQHRARIEAVRAAARACGQVVGILADLQGPKLRIGQFSDGKVSLKKNAIFQLDKDKTPGDATRIGLDYAPLIDEVDIDDVMVLDDGRVLLTVIEKDNDRLITRVMDDAVLSNHKGINKRGGGLSAPALTEKDKADIGHIAALGCDMVAVSFPKNAEDMLLAKKYLQAAGSNASRIAKIERTEAVENLDEILAVSDGVMVARGDLAIEVGDARVPGIQKRIIRAARAKTCFVITATQMMESMIHASVPTRAEVSDVSNAVLDGTDAVMLSAETAIGQYPIQTVAMVDQVCREAEKTHEPNLDALLSKQAFTKIDETIAMTTLFAAKHLGIKAIAALTHSGSTALWMSRYISGVPIYAMTPLAESQQKMSIYRGVTPFFMEQSDRYKTLLQQVEQRLVAENAVADGDIIAITIGHPLGRSGGTNTLKLIVVGSDW